MTRDVVDRAMAAATVERQVAFEVNNVHWLLDLVGYGLGVAVVPEVFRAAPSWQVAVAAATGRHPAAAAMARLSRADP